MEDEAYDKEYAEAMARLEAGAAPEATTPREPNGQFAPAEQSAPATQPEPVAAEVEPVESTPVPEAVPAAPEVDRLEEYRLKMEKYEKALKDTQAWGTRNAQRIAELEKERQQQLREASKPKLLVEHPDLEQAIRYAANTSAPQQDQEAQRLQEWRGIVSSVHPGIFDDSVDPELMGALMERKAELGDEWFDPLVTIREITEQKVAHTERQLAKKYKADLAKNAQKSAMSVPGAGSGVVNTAPVDKQKLDAERYRTMPLAEFEREKRRLMGLQS